MWAGFRTRHAVAFTITERPYGATGSHIFVERYAGEVVAGTATIPDNGILAGTQSQLAVVSGTLAGAWRALGSATISPATSYARATLFVRITEWIIATRKAARRGYRQRGKSPTVWLDTVHRARRRHRRNGLTPLCEHHCRREQYSGRHRGYSHTWKAREEAALAPKIIAKADAFLAMIGTAADLRAKAQLAVAAATAAAIPLVDVEGQIASLFIQLSQGGQTEISKLTGQS